MVYVSLYAFLLTGLFYFSEGKPCPQKTRAHQTRCDVYYKCTELSTPLRSHVWAPVNCEEGLVYEHNLSTCVLPGDDWECSPADYPRSNKRHIENSKMDEDIDIVGEPEDFHLLNVTQQRFPDDGNVEIVLDGELSSEEYYDDVDNADGSQQGGNVSNHYDSSGDGELVEMDGVFLQVENREAEDHPQQQIDENNESNMNVDAPTHKEAIMELAAELKQVNDVQKPPNRKAPPVDPNLTAHLQRLSQLIDGLKQTYQQPNDKEHQQELRPDQLNAFLAHFNIKNRFDALTPSDNNFNMERISLSTSKPPTTSTTTMPPLTHLPMPTLNKTRLQEHLSLINNLEPETKVVLANALPKIYGDEGAGAYSNSQIVVNRPEGSVMFTLPNYSQEKHYLEQLQYQHQQQQLQQHQQQQQLQQHQQHQQQQHLTHDYNEPKISEETLKTVLELSKQMIAAQNVPKVISNPYYAQPILQPVILSPHGGPYTNYYATNNNGNYGVQHQHQHQHQHHQNQHQSSYGHSSSGHSHKKPHHRPSMIGGSGGNGGGGGYSKPSTTIIHNNVIPVHVSTTSSGEKEVLDSYGNSLGLYPPVHTEEQLQYNNNFVTTITTARPAISVTTMATQYAGQYPTPYATEFTLTTPRPFDHQPTPETIATYYTPSPHLSNHNVNHIFHTENYADIGSLPRPLNLNMNRPGQGHEFNGYGSNAAALFPSAIDVNKVKIRPNSQKIESMEVVDADELINAQNYGNSNNAGVLTYSSSSSGSGSIINNNEDMSTQLASSSSSTSPYIDHALKHPYMPRPSTTNTFSYGTTNLDLSNAGGYDTQLPSLTKYTNMNTNKLNKYGSVGGTNADNSQLVNFNGNFISLDVFQNSILPLVSQSNSFADLNKVEVITCQAGVRQPNITDCMRYFVCSKKDGKVLSYSCPPFTAFNSQTRICDAHTYSVCNPLAVMSTYTVNENKRIQLEAFKALQEAKKRQEAALKAQSIANLLQQYGNPQSHESNADQDMLGSYMQQAAALGQNTPSYVPTSTMRPLASISATPTTTSSTVKKRKYYCKEGDKIPDQTSISSYFICYKNAQGQMKGHKMTCSKNLLFCPKTTMCTLPVKCA